MPDIWQQLVNDPQFDLGRNTANPAFRIFVEDTLPEVLTGISAQICTIETLMETQYLCADALAKNSLKTNGPLAKIRQGLSQYEDADIFLYVADITEREYCCNRSGMYPTEFIDMIAGRLLIRDLLEKHPGVLLSPVLRELKTLH